MNGLCLKCLLFFSLLLLSACGENPESSGKEKDTAPQEQTRPEKSIQAEQEPEDRAYVDLNVDEIRGNELKGKEETYSLNHLTDMDLSTWWSPNDPRDGNGAELSFEFTRRIDGFRISSGVLIREHSQHGDLYAKNNRPKTILIRQKEHLEKFILPDRYGSFLLIPDKPFEGKKIQVTFEDVYRGSTWNDLCLSELMPIQKVDEAGTLYGNPDFDGWVRAVREEEERDRSEWGELSLRSEINPVGMNTEELVGLELNLEKEGRKIFRIGFTPEELGLEADMRVSNPDVSDQSGGNYLLSFDYGVAFSDGPGKMFLLISPEGELLWNEGLTFADPVFFTKDGKRLIYGNQMLDLSTRGITDLLAEGWEPIAAVQTADLYALQASRGKEERIFLYPDDFQEIINQFPCHCYSENGMVSEIDLDFDYGEIHFVDKEAGKKVTVNLKKPEKWVESSYGWQ